MTSLFHLGTGAIVVIQSSCAFLHLHFSAVHLISCCLINRFFLISHFLCFPSDWYRWGEALLVLFLDFSLLSFIKVTLLKLTVVTGRTGRIFFYLHHLSKIFVSLQQQNWFYIFSARSRMIHEALAWDIVFPYFLETFIFFISWVLFHCLLLQDKWQYFPRTFLLNFLLLSLCFFSTVTLKVVTVHCFSEW